MDDNVRKRRLILKLLYDEKKSTLLGKILTSDLAKQLELKATEVEFHIGYLQDKGLLIRQEQMIGTRKVDFVTISYAGIDMMEVPNEFNQRFPPQAIIQNIMGDKMDITFGDNATNVSVGKDIQTVQINAADINDKAFFSKVIREIKEFPRLTEDQKEKLLNLANQLCEILTEKQLDLGKVQQIKSLMSTTEGKPAIWTAIIFSQELVVSRVHDAIDDLIGHSEGRVDR